MNVSVYEIAAHDNAILGCVDHLPIAQEYAFYVETARGCGLDDDEIEEDLLARFGYLQDVTLEGNRLLICALEEE
jgi:hypothetical protein